MDAMTVDGSLEQAHVLLTNELTHNGERTFDLWLTHEGGGWRVNGFFASLSAIMASGCSWSIKRPRRGVTSTTPIGEIANSSMRFARPIQNGPRHSTPSRRASPEDTSNTYFGTVFSNGER